MSLWLCFCRGHVGSVTGVLSIFGSLSGAGGGRMGCFCSQDWLFSCPGPGKKPVLRAKAAHSTPTSTRERPKDRENTRNTSDMPPTKTQPQRHSPFASTASTVDFKKFSLEEKVVSYCLKNTQYSKFFTKAVKK